VVALTKPIQSFSILPWGESDDPASPHYTDQAEKLFSKATFKSTFFNKNELMENLEATKNLVIPELKK
jgi:acyl-homoserine lactone acylase PvdQ